jgi:hypothetical protein
MAKKEKGVKEKVKEEKAVDAKKETKKAKPSGGLRGAWAVVFIVIMFIAVAGGLVYGLNRSTGTSITTFENNFNSAPTIAIVVSAKNNTELGPPISCATNLIEEITSAHGSAHRSASSIVQYYMNASICSYSQIGVSENATAATPAQCLSMSSAYPRIVINYSDTNSTTITPDALYVSGNLQFLSECGVASEISAS